MLEKKIKIDFNIHRIPIINKKEDIKKSVRLFYQIGISVKLLHYILNPPLKIHNHIFYKRAFSHTLECDQRSLKLCFYLQQF